jgi:ferric-dicitrate binding protein FerR (iron transport regulator)
MPGSEKDLKDLLDKYEKGTCTPAEKALLEAWYHSLDMTAPGDQAPNDLQKNLTLIWQGLEKDTAPKKIIRLPYLRIAAAVIILLISAALLFRQTSHRQRTTAPAFVSMTTAARQVKEIRLPDSTIVWLNASSSLQYSENMGADSIRRVTLVEGEAFFDIKQDPAHPFEVITPRGIRTTVLGTSFDMKAYANDKTLSVAVVTGKVRVSNGTTITGQDGILTAGQGLSINTDTSQTFDRYTTNLHTAGGWRSGQLEFDNATLEEIAHALERWYKVPVRSAGPYARNARYNARFNKGETLKEVLRLLSITNGLRYKTTSDTTYINSK